MSDDLFSTLKCTPETLSTPLDLVRIAFSELDEFIHKYNRLFRIASCWYSPAKRCHKEIVLQKIKDLKPHLNVDDLYLSALNLNRLQNCTES